MRHSLLIAALAALLLLPPPCSSAPEPEVAFSPHGGATELVVHTIDSAKTSIRCPKIQKACYSRQAY